MVDDPTPPANEVNAIQAIEPALDGPLSSSQMSIWYVLQLDPASTVYHIVSLYRCREGLDTDVFEQAYNQVLRRQPALRTTFGATQGEGRQVVQPFVPAAIEKIDFSGYPATEREQRAREYARMGGKLPGSLENGPLVRLQLLRLSERQYFLLLCVHHIVCDGGSVALLKNELAYYYQAIQEGTQATLPEVRIDPLQFATWERQWLQGQAAQAMREYWMKQMAGPLPVIELPGRNPHRPVNNRLVKRYPFTLSGYIYKQIKQTCETYKLSTFRVMATAYAVQLMQATGLEDIIIGCPFSNRNFADLGKDLDQTIGMFVNMLPLRFNLGGDPTIPELMQRVQDTVRGAQKNQSLPFEKLVAAINPARAANIMPIFQVMINFQNVTRRSSQDLLLYDREFDHSKTVFDLDLDIKEIDRELACNLIYNGDLFDEAFAQQFAADYGRTLEVILANPGARLSALKQSLPGPGKDPFVNEKTTSASGRKASLMNGPDQEKSAHPNNLLGYSQESLWFLQRLDPQIPAYNGVSLLRLKGPLKVPALEQSINEVFHRHSALRAFFPEENGEPKQLIRPFEPVRLALQELPGLHYSERAEKIAEMGRREMATPFDLEEGPAYRVSLVAFDAQDHLLMLSTHHIVWDGWSHQLIMDELSRGYNAFASGGLPQLPDLPLQYSDYVNWQHQQAQQGALDEHLDYWLANIDPGSSQLNLPYDHPHPAVQTYAAGRYITNLSPQSSEAFKAFCKQERVTLYMGFLAALDVLLYRYTGQGTITIGCPFANRTEPEFDRLIGFFVNTMPVQVTLDGGLTFRQVLGRARERMLGAMAHQSLPFEKLVAEINPQRDLSRLPLFQIVLNFRNVPRYTLDQSQLQIEKIEVDLGVTAFEIDITIVENPAGLQLVCMYNNALFERETIARLMGCWQNIIENALEGPDAPVGRLGLLPEAEFQKIVYEWNNTRVDYPALCTHQLVEAQVERSPDAPAVIFENASLTYNEFNRLANRFARRLRGMGVGANSLVAVCLERSAEMPAALLAVHKAGGAYLPLDPAYPQKRLRFMLEDASPQVLLTQKKFMERLPKSGFAVCCIDDELLEPTGADDDNLTTVSGPDDLAFVRYTSGSTGKPKGVRIRQRSVVNTLTHLGRQFGMNAQDRLLAITTISFDISDVEMFLPLMAGAQLFIASTETAADGNLLMDMVTGIRPTVMQATPTTWRMLLLAGWHGSAGMKIISGGEALTPDLKEDLLKRCLELWNIYGPTETAIYSIGGRVLPEAGHITIGRPLSNTNVYILDEHMQPLPVGIAGYIYIGGVGVSPGYLRRPELDAERFIGNPFVPGDRLYATGDLARFLPDGEVEYLGRGDQQVKVRGFRIELGEIEAVLKQHPDIRDVVLGAAPDPFGTPEITAYFIGRRPNLSPGSLRIHLAGLLPVFMIPARFVQVDAFPTLPNGKIDRKALAATREGAPGGHQKVAPRTETEAQLLEIWCELLDAPEIGVTDNFFDLGGHSLMAVRLFARIENKFHQRIPLASLFVHGTIEQLASLIQSGPVTRPVPALVPIQPDGSRRPLYVVPGMGGSVLYYRSLALLLGSDQPVFGLHSMLAGGGWKVESVEAIAADFVREIRAFQPEGPYLIAGHSFGGFVALEMARKLTAEGEQVGLLALFDTLPPLAAQTPKPPDLVALHLMDRVKYHLKTLFTLDGAARREYLAEFFRFQSQRQGAGPLGMFAKKAGMFTNADIDQSLAALSKYMPAPYAFDVTVFKVNEHAWLLRWDPMDDWANFVRGKLRVYTVPGEHINMLEDPFVGEVARLLKECLEGEWISFANTGPWQEEDHEHEGAYPGGAAGTVRSLGGSAGGDEPGADQQPAAASGVVDQG